MLTPAAATHYAGSQITYRPIDSLVYEVTFDIYRDCRGVKVYKSDYNFLLHSRRGPTDTLDVTLTKIANVTLVCDTVTRACSPPNTYNAGEGTEKITFVDTVDFKGQYRRLYDSGVVFFALSGCCRTDGIYANTAVYNYSMLDLRKVTWNHSPKFYLDFNRFLPLNQAVYEYFGVTDRKEEDSVSFRIVPALRSFSSIINYNPGRTYKIPFKVYDPGNTGLVNPFASPPTGFYFDEKLGGMVFTPVSIEESTVAYEVLEWRKDSSGEYQHVGTVRRDLQYMVNRAPDNHSPVIRGDGISSVFEVCDGELLDIDVTTSDKPFKPPPPDPAPAPDSLDVRFLKLPDGATGTITNPNSLNPGVNVRWRPELSNTSPRSYYFTVVAADDQCPYPARSSRTFEIVVHPKKPDSILSIQSEYISCGQYSLAYEATDTTTPSRIRWSVLDSTGTVLTNNSRVRFNSNSAAHSGSAEDSFYLNSSGMHIIRLEVWYGGKCATVAYDTIVQTYRGYDLIAVGDTFVCGSDSITLHPDPKIGIAVGQYLWKIGNDTFISDSIKTRSFSTQYKVLLQGLDTFGCPQSDSIYIRGGKSPEISFVPNDRICPGEVVTYDALSYTDTGYLQTRFEWENGSTDPIRQLDSSADYSFKAINGCGEDSAIFNILVRPDPRRAPSIATIPDDTLCRPFEKQIDLKDYLGVTGPQAEVQWSTGSDSFTETFYTEGEYAVVVVNLCGTDTARFTLRSDTIPVLQPLPDDTFCWPEQRIVEAYLANDPGASKVEYEWNTGTKGEFIVPSGNAEYKVRAMNQCGVDSSSFRAYFYTAPSIALDSEYVVSKPFQLTLVADTVEAGYLWNTGDTTPELTIDQPGLYYVIVENPCGFDLQEIWVRTNTGIQASKIPAMKVIPNPTHGMFVLEIEEEAEVRSIHLYNAIGALVCDFKPNKRQFDISSFQSGIYSLRVETESAVHSVNLVVE